MAYGPTVDIRYTRHLVVDAQFPTPAAQVRTPISPPLHELNAKTYHIVYIRSKFHNPAIRAMAIRTLIASTASFVSSATNVAIFIGFRGELTNVDKAFYLNERGLIHPKFILIKSNEGSQPGYFCMTACSADIALNALALAYVTKPGEVGFNAEGSSVAKERQRNIRRNAEGDGTRRRPRTICEWSRSFGSVEREDGGVNSRGEAVQDEEYLRPLPNVILPKVPFGRHPEDGLGIVIEDRPPSRSYDPEARAAAFGEQPIQPVLTYNEKGEEGAADECDFLDFLKEGPPQFSPLQHQSSRRFNRRSRQNDEIRQMGWMRRKVERLVFGDDGVPAHDIHTSSSSSNGTSLSK